MASLSTRQKKKAMIEAFRRKLSNVTAACNAVGITRETHYRWMRDDESYAQEIENAIEATGDYVEDKLMKHIQADDLTAIIFYCKTKPLK